MIPVVAALIVREQKLLLAKRLSKAKRPDLWEMPGGKVEVGETTHQALARELSEELGVKDPVIHTPIVAVSQIEISYSWVVIVHTADLQGQEPRALESQEIRYFDLDEAVERLPCVPSIYLFYRQLRDAIHIFGDQ